MEKVLCFGLSHLMSWCCQAKKKSKKAKKPRELISSPMSESRAGASVSAASSEIDPQERASSPTPGEATPSWPSSPISVAQATTMRILGASPLKPRPEQTLGPAAGEAEPVEEAKETGRGIEAAAPVEARELPESAEAATEAGAVPDRVPPASSAARTAAVPVPVAATSGPKNPVVGKDSNELAEGKPPAGVVKPKGTLRAAAAAWEPSFLQVPALGAVTQKSVSPETPSGQDRCGLSAGSPEPAAKDSKKSALRTPDGNPIPLLALFPGGPLPEPSPRMEAVKKAFASAVPGSSAARQDPASVPLEPQGADIEPEGAGIEPAGADSEPEGADVEAEEVGPVVDEDAFGTDEVVEGLLEELVEDAAVAAGAPPRPSPRGANSPIARSALAAPSRPGGRILDNVHVADRVQRWEGIFTAPSPKPSEDVEEVVGKLVAGIFGRVRRAAEAAAAKAGGEEQAKKPGSGAPAPSQMNVQNLLSRLLPGMSMPMPPAKPAKRRQAEQPAAAEKPGEPEGKPAVKPAEASGSGMPPRLPSLRSVQSAAQRSGRVESEGSTADSATPKSDAGAPERRPLDKRTEDAVRCPLPYCPIAFAVHLYLHRTHVCTVGLGTYGYIMPM